LKATLFKTLKKLYSLQNSKINHIFRMKIKKGIPLIDQHDKNGFWGGKFGGNFIPETLKKPVEDLNILFEKLRKDKNFIKERDYYFKNWVGTPTSFIKLENLTSHLGGAQVWTKVVSEANGGAHKIYNATVHCLITKRAGKKYIVGDTGAGYAGKMLSMAAKKFGLKCKIFMGAKDIRRQKPNCDAMKKNGAEIVPVHSGSQTLVDAVSECMRYWVANCDSTAMCVGSTVGPNIFVKICGWSTAQISRELLQQIKNEFGEIPNKLKLINCVGGGSSAYGFWSEFMDYSKKQVEMIGVEAAGPKRSKLHAAPLSKGAKLGILHGAASYVCQNSDGQIKETESISAGLDYPGVSPMHCFLKDSGRARYSSATDEEALEAYKLVTKYENLNPSLEPSHAFAEAIKIAPRLSNDTVIIVNSCGDAQKDRDILRKRLGKY
jgi:tryptophan synthase/tryptophan synthase beta chain